MIKKLFTIALGTFLGILLTFFLLTMSIFLIISNQNLINNQNYLQNQASPHSILHISLTGRLIEGGSKKIQHFLRQDKAHNNDLFYVKNIIKNAQIDPAIQGLYIETNNLATGWAGLTELREVLQNFKKTGKFIIAYSQNYTAQSYYLISLADEIILNPAGIFLFKGLSMQTFFYKDVLDTLAISPQVFRAGKYKSAIEPFTRKNMSEAEKEQLHALLDDTYDILLNAISTERKITTTTLKNLANQLSVLDPKEAKKEKLITQVGYFHDVEIWLRKKLNLGPMEHINYINAQNYVYKNNASHSSKSKIAVLSAVGTITEEGYGPNFINQKKFINQLRKLREDKYVKAIVLRINSPGGSSLASDTMWKEIMLTNEIKPVIASLGDLAASGGYYLAVACRYIVAQPTTITGSIGVFGIYFDLHKLLNEKIGICNDGIKTNPTADFFNFARPFTTIEKIAVQKHIDNTYDAFLTKVATGRKMKKEIISRLADGRVWSGKMAKKQGLVDALGGLEEAIQKAIQIAGEDVDYEIIHWLDKENTWLEQLLVNTTVLLKINHLFSFLNEPWNYYCKVFPLAEQAIYQQGVQAWLPYTICID